MKKCSCCHVQIVFLAIQKLLEDFYGEESAKKATITAPDRGN